MATKPQTNTVDFFIGLPKEFKPIMTSNNSNDDSGIKTAIFLLKSNEWSFEMIPIALRKLLSWIY